MRKKKINFIIFISIVWIYVGCSTNVNSISETPFESSQNKNKGEYKNTNSNELINVNDQTSQKNEQSALRCESRSTQITYKGVNFLCNNILASEIEITEFPESPLEFEQDKPDYVHPQYLSFKFKDGIAYQGRSSDYDININVYPIEDFRKMYLASKSQTQQFDENIKSLTNLFREKPVQLNKQIPFINLTDAYQVVKAHVKYPSFKNGQGVAFVTQFTTEAEVINNQELIWVFQGITDNGNYYVYATFPVSVPFLPKDRNSAGKNDYTVPIDFWSKDEHQQYQEQYNQYLATVRGRLQKLDSNQFEPNLNYLIELISSLKIEH